MGVYLIGVYLTGVYLMGVYFMNMHYRMQPFYLVVCAAFGGPGLMPHFSFWR
jgi:hypothetical protein